MENNKKTSIFDNGLIWFGAGVSIAEIVTGTYLAPLGFARGFLAVVIGHVIGCIMLFMAGVIGGKSQKSSMETVKMSFGAKGGLFFAICNVLQLVGWTAIMIFDGALAANEVFSIGIWVWALVIGILIIVWILIGLTNLGKVNTVAMSALFILTIVLCKVIFFSGATPIASQALGEAMSFGAAVELSVAMPLSWLPLISDYTRDAQKPVAATAVSAIVYGIVSCWMYIIGMGAAIFTGESDIASILLKAGLGVAGLLVVLFSTVTTTFLDAFSAGISAESLSSKINGKITAIIVTIVGTVAAIIFPIYDITDFLYLIGSIFAPMIAIQIADYFVLPYVGRAVGKGVGLSDVSQRKDCSDKNFDVANLIIWLIGFVLYRYLMTMDIVVGNTLPDMVITVIICLAVSMIFGKKQDK